MAPEIKLVITENNKIIKTVTNETNPQASYLIKSLHEFQKLVNAAVTALIEDRGGSNHEDVEEASGESEEDDDAIPVTPKKKKK